MSAAVDGKVSEFKSSWPDPAVPSKGLLPKSLVAKRQVRKFTIQAGIVGFVLVAVAAIGWGAVESSAVSAGSDQANQELQNGTLKTSITQMQAVDQQVKGLNSQRQNIAVALQNDVVYSAVIADVRAAAPLGVVVDSIKPALGTVCPGPDPFNAKPAIGCLTISGAAPSVAAVSAYVQSLLDLSKVPGKPAWLVDPFASSATAGGDTTGSTGIKSGIVVRFTLTVNFTPQALSLRYSKFLPGTGSTKTSTPVVTKVGG